MPTSGNNDEKMIDYISELPDAILCSILSFLPTLNAVRTSILSKRWIYVWTQVPVIDIPWFRMRRWNTGSHEKRKIYHHFMSRFLVLHNVNCLKHFTFTESIDDEDTLNAVMSWLDVLRRRQYCKLNMTLGGDLAPLPLPNEFLSSHRLVVLKLDGFCIDDSQEFFHLPSLESVHFEYHMVFPSDRFLKRFLLGCPVLKSLYIKRGCGLGHIYVESSTLMSLEITELKYEPSHKPAMRITIKAPNLRDLTLFDAYARYDIDDLNLLSKADIGFAANRPTQLLDDNLVQLVKKVSPARTLMLRGAEFRLFNDVLPRFENLTELKLFKDHCAYELLKRAPKLKSLSFDIGQLGKFLDCDVPACLSCLEKVEYLCYRNADTSVAEYFLKNGSNLKEMIVYVSNFSLESWINLHRTQEASILSPNCQIKVFSVKNCSCLQVAWS